MVSWSCIQGALWGSNVSLLAHESLWGHAVSLPSSCSSSLLDLPADPQATPLHSLKMQHLTHCHSLPLLLVISESTWNPFQNLGFLVSLPSQLWWPNLPPTSASLFAMHTVITDDCTAAIGSVSSIRFSELHLLSWLTPSGTPTPTIHWIHPCLHWPLV